MGQNANYRQIGSPMGYLARRFTFKGNTMRASLPEGQDRDLAYLSHCGQLYLHPEVQAKMREDAENGLEACYVVWSYNTPIAWLRSDGQVIVPNVKYSSTTSRQQSLCRAWLKSDREMGWADR